MGRDQRQNPNAQLTDEQRRANELLRAELAAQGPRLKDRFNRPIVVGVQTLYHSDIPIIFRVAEIAQSLDPRVPPGVWMVTLETSLIIPMAQGVPNMEMICVVYPKEQTTAPPTEEPPPAADQPPAAPPGGIALTDAVDLREESPPPTAKEPLQFPREKPTDADTEEIV